jgi:chromosome segregation ATPase
MSHVAIFQTNGDQFKSAITKLQEEKNKIQTQIAKGQYQGGKFDDHDFDDIRGQIKDFQSQIDKHNNDRNQYSNEINGHQSNINQCNEQINKYRSDSQYSRGIVDQ